MRRHPALQQLSRDHHHALVVAQLMKRTAEPAAAAKARDEFLTYWEADGRDHFREEEEILLPACADVLNLDEPIIAKVLTDHIRIRHLADKVSRASRPSQSVLRELGAELEAHVRREERELFPLIERSLPDQELRRLVERLRH